MYRLRVKEVLHEKGVTQTWLARHTTLTEAMVRRLVRDPSYLPSIATMAKVAKALQVHIDDLIEEIPDPQPFAPSSQEPSISSSQPSSQTRRASSSADVSFTH
ncbi:helix-turn-helix domain-containing protein [Thermogemmatispora sp.]|uniref:helix-turn-helix domain-containing protein n=1 Tax=Thermogemmatispora sp. TaxID=1968838 RepID=UPI001DE0989B|nr:helix-turn-helix transcriptional regulator [Thermogemmatispora sp.]